MGGGGGFEEGGGGGGGGGGVGEAPFAGADGGDDFRAGEVEAEFPGVRCWAVLAEGRGGEGEGGEGVPGGRRRAGSGVGAGILGGHARVHGVPYPLPRQCPVLVA